LNGEIMGEPATPTEAERLATRALAASIVEAVRNDEEWPTHHHLRTSIDGLRAYFEEVVFALAQEVTLLLEEKSRT
jgi:hypothetical protein